MDEWIPEPDDRVTVLAEQQRLGRWRTGAANVQGSFRKQWGDARLHLYENGLIVTAPENSEWLYRWESTTVLQHLTTLNGKMQDATYTLIGPDGAALTVGRGGNGIFRREYERFGITSYTRGPWVVYERAWGPEIQKGVASAQWPTTVERLRRGETVMFGRISVDHRTVTIGKKSESWTRIAKVRTSNGNVFLEDARGRGLLFTSASKVPNLHLFLALADQLRG